MTVTLPLPPSANRYWRTVAVRGKVVTYVSEEAKAYKEEVGWLLRAAGFKPLTGPAAARYDVFLARDSGDLDNRAKVLGDVLEGFAFTNDKQIQRIEMSRHIDRANPRVVVTVEEATR